MALNEDLRRLIGFDQGPDNNAEVNIKIKPLGGPGSAPGGQAPSPSQAATVGVGGGGGGAGGSGVGPPVTEDPLATLGLAGGVQTGAGSQQSALTPTPGTGFGLGGESLVPFGQRQLFQSPQLVTHPLGAQTDSMYEAAVAQLRNDTTNRYLDTLKELGFLDTQGQFIPGTLETDAMRARSDFQRNRELALEQVLNQAVNRGAVFSGRRATLQSQAQAPYDAALANLESTLTRELGNRYDFLGRTTQNFETQRNILLSEAASRIAAALQGGPAGPGGPPGPGPSAPVPSDGFTPIYPGTWAEGIDTGGYVPNSNVVTDYGPSPPKPFKRSGDLVPF